MEETNPAEIDGQEEKTTISSSLKRLHSLICQTENLVFGPSPQEAKKDIPKSKIANQIIKIDQMVNKIITINKELKKI